MERFNGVNKRIITLIKQRIDKGQKEYNREVPIQRERGLTNLEEAIDEVLDLTVYLTAYLLELEQDKQNKPFKVEVHDMQYILQGLHNLHSNAYEENSLTTANEIYTLITALKSGSKWGHEEDKRIGQTDNPINEIHDVSPHDPGDENDNVRNGPTKCIQGSNCD